MNSSSPSQIKLKDPIFICGEGRSGTKLLRDTLARHSGINFFRCETYIFVKSKLHRIKNLDLAEKSGDLGYLVKAVIACVVSKNKNIAAKTIKNKNFDLEIENLAKELQAHYQLEFDTLDIFDKVAHLLTLKAQKSRWLEKTPFHIYYLDEIFAKYPNAKAVLTLRDPKAVYASWKKKDPDKSLIGVAESWNKVNQEIEKAQNKYQNIMLVKFEDLVAKPKETLTELCDFIGENFEEALLDAEVVNSKFEENKKSGFDKDIINRWQEQLSEREIMLIDKLCFKENNPTGLLDYLYYYFDYIMKKFKKLWSWLGA